MARARNIKPGFFTNEDLVELPFHVRLLFIGLWTVADRAGRMEDRPKKIKMAIFPADDVNVDDGLDQLQKAGFLMRYEVDGTGYIQILAFDKHQHPHKDEKQSTIPAPCLPGAPTVPPPDQPPANPADSPKPDSPKPETPNSAGEAPAGAVSAVQLSIEMRKAGVQSQPADPRLIALASQGVTPETVTAACEAAKKSNPNRQISVGYVVAILERWAQEAADLKANGAKDPRAPAPVVSKPILTPEQQVPGLNAVRGKKPEGIGSLKSLLRPQSVGAPT